MVIYAVEISNNCYSNDDGKKLYVRILKELKDSTSIIISFKGVDSVSSSFVNASLIPLLDVFSFEEIKKRVYFSETTPQINEIIKSRFAFETNHKRES